MPKILKNFNGSEAEPYRFPKAEELVVAADEPAEAKRPAPRTPVEYAQVQADAIVQEAQAQADTLLEQARRDMEAELEQIRADAREEGYTAGLREGMVSASQETRRLREEQAAELAAAAAKFLSDAAAENSAYLAGITDELRDLTVAIAEKVIRVSLKSSNEIIGRMIMAATEKHKREEWVHIYIAGCDAKAMAKIPPALSAALAGISDRIRIIPMAEDESGTCIVEMPDEIIDASVSTQLSNIQSMLSDYTVSAPEPPAQPEPYQFHL